MSGCLDNVHCECFDLGDHRRNMVASIVGGVLFFTGWWMQIGQFAVSANPATPYSGWFVIVSVAGTISMIMINAISNTQVRGDSMTDSIIGAKGARLWLLIGFVLGFGALIAASWIMFEDYILPNNVNVWPGILLLMHNLLIFLGSLAYKFGRTEELWGM